MARSIKIRCREIAAYALRTRRIRKPEKCEKCGNPGRLVMHHEDYFKPLEVTWLCTHCHGVYENAKRKGKKYSVTEVLDR